MSNLRIDVTANVQGAVTGLEQVRKSTQRTGAAISGATTNMRRMNGQITTSQKNFGRFVRGGMQQAGYQIGDYAVQVANGTSKMQAFGQQAPQLLQVFGPIGAVVGAAVAIFAAFAVVAQRSSKKAKDFSEALDDLKKSTDLYSSAANSANSSVSDLTKKYGMAAEKARALFKAQESLRRLDAIESLGASVIAVRDEFGDFGDVTRAAIESAHAAYTNLGDDINKPWNLGDRELAAANSAMELYEGSIQSLEKTLGTTKDRAFDFAKELSDLSAASGPDEIAQELDQVRSMFIDIVGGVDSANESQRELYRSLVNSSLAALALNTAIDKTEDTAQTQQASIQRLSDSYRTYASTRVSGAAMVAANEVAVAKITNARVFSSYKQYGGLRVAEAWIAAGELLKVEAHSAAEQLTFIEKLKTAHSVYRWSRISGAAMVADAEGAQAAAANARMLAAYRQFGDSRIAAAWLASTRIEQIQDDIDLPDMSGPLRDFSDVIDNEVSPAMLRLKSVQESVSSAIENGMMSMVDGTQSVKEAFKSMASAIIKDLYRMFVVKRITGFISGAIGGYFNANQVSGPSMPLGTGNIRPPHRAMGGQVTGGKSYMVGERGPEMVVPSRNGHVVPNNQVGGGGGVTVIQNNTFGNGVNRAEINAMLPKIVEASKAAVLDAKRRGGSFAGAF